MQNSFKNISYLFSGNILALLIPYIASPILTRLYSAAAFGEFGQFIAWASILSISASGGFEYSIILPKNKKTASNLMILGLSSSLLITLFSIIGLFIISKFSINFNLLYFLLPFYILNLALQRLFNYWLNRNEQYKAMAIASATRSVVTSPAQIVFSSLWKNISGLIIGDFLGQIAKLFVLIKKSKLDRKSLIINRKELWATYKVYKNFPKFAMPSELLNHLSIQLPVLLLIYFFGETAAGLYFLPHKLLSAPLNALGNAVSQIYFKDSSLIKESKEKISQLSEQLFKQLFLLGLLPFGILFFFGSEIFEFMFGSAWIQAGQFASYISPWLFLVFIISPLSIIFTVFEKLKLSLKLNTILFFIRLVSLLIGGFWLKSLNSTIILYAVSSTIYWFILALIVFKFAHIKLNKISGFILKWFSVCTSILLLTKYLGIVME